MVGLWFLPMALIIVATADSHTYFVPKAQIVVKAIK
jgi:hypothetical protein